MLKRNALGLLIAAYCMGTTVVAATAMPVDTPAEMSPMAASSPLLGVDLAGERVVAVGQRGHIVVSDDDGKQWRQAQVPVSIDLVAVSFGSSQKGWAVGHDGIVLHSADGGVTWERQLDGLQTAKLAVEYMKEYENDPAFQPFVRQAQYLMADAEAGAPQPLFDVLFDSETSGFIVGAFNQIFRTENGGQTWQPWMSRVDNPRELHFYAIEQSGNEVYLTGEQGMVWRLSADEGKFVSVPTGYQGTLFGLVAAPGVVMAYGMNGTLFRSEDQGATWSKVDIDSRHSINAGTVLTDGRVLLVNSAGEVMESSDAGKTFSPLPVPARMQSYFGVSKADRSKITLVGSNGAQIVSIR